MKQLNKKWGLIVLFLISTWCSLKASDSTQTWMVGPAMRKYVGFYWLNGVSAEWQPKSFRKYKCFLGATLVHSNLGTNLFSKAIPTFNFEISAIRKFTLAKNLSTRIAVNGGYAHANYGNPTFDKIANQAPLVGLDVGVDNQHQQWLMAATLGYQGISGTGVKGLATVYPVYLQIKAFYLISKLKKD